MTLTITKFIIPKKKFKPKCDSSSENETLDETLQVLEW
jgi:hypothetical protein